MKIYYAHSMHLYNTPQEKRDIELLEKMGFEVYNPNCEEVQKGVLEYKEKYGDDKTMEYFVSLVDVCDGLAYRSHVDFRIPSGVASEIKTAMGLNKFIFELPTLLNSRFMEVGETRQYLQYNGQR